MTRRFYNRLGRKQCPHVETLKKEECVGPREVCLPGEVERIDPACAVTDWSLWSPCSVSCGNGIKVRTRLYRVTREEQLRAGCTVQLMEKGTCTGRKEDCNWGNTEDICGQEMEVGPCRGYFTRWFHDPESRTCKQFTFGGCRGNSNNFLKLEDCLNTCQSYKTSDELSTNPLQFSTNLMKDKNFMMSLDVLAQQRREQQTEGMNEIFMEIEQQRQVVTDLEEEQTTLGVFFNKRAELMAAQKKLMMMEKQVMMKKQMEMFQQKQRMMNQKKNRNDSPYDREFADTPIPPQARLQDAALLQQQQQRNAASLQKQSAHRPLQQYAPSLYAVQNSTRVQDCELTAWSPWSVQCSATCGRGFRHRFRTVSKPALGGGQPCSRKLDKKKKCRLPSCPVTCQRSDWTAWGPCSQTCGTDGVQSRYRQVLSGTACEPEEELRVCLLSCCPGDRSC